MFTPLFFTLGILGALYLTRGPVNALWPGRYYLVGFPSSGLPVTQNEIDLTRAAVQESGFGDVKYDRSTLENGQRYYWFKGTWKRAATNLYQLNPASRTKVYESLF